MCVMTVTKLALHPREHAETLDIVDDRVHEVGAFRPRLVPLRVHEGGVHARVHELLVEQDATGKLLSRLDTIGMFGQPNGDCCSEFSTVLHGE